MRGRRARRAEKPLPVLREEASEDWGPPRQREPGGPRGGPSQRAQLVGRAAEFEVGALRGRAGIAGEGARKAGPAEPAEGCEAVWRPTEAARKGCETWGSKRKGVHSACNGKEAKAREEGGEEVIQMLT